MVDLETSYTGRTPQELYHHILTEMQTNPAVTPLSFYKEFLRFLIARFGQLYFKNSNDEVVRVKCTHARPERAIAKLNQEQNIILPTATVSQVAVQEADNRRRVGSLFIHEKQWNEDIQRAERILRIVDRPVNIMYSLNIWSKYIADMDQLAEQIRLLFNPALTVKTPYDNQSRIFLDSESDNSTLFLADREDRIIKRSFSLRLETYIQNPRFKVTSTGKIERMEIEAIAQ